MNEQQKADMIAASIQRNNKVMFKEVFGMDVPAALNSLAIMPETQTDPSCKTREYADAFDSIRASLEECSVTIEETIMENAEDIQDFRFTYQEKLKTAGDIERLKAESWDKIMDLIDRKLDELASDEAVKQVAG